MASGHRLALVYNLLHVRALKVFASSFVLLARCLFAALWHGWVVHSAVGAEQPCLQRHTSTHVHVLVAGGHRPATASP